MVNEPIVDYHPSPSGLTSRMHPLRFPIPPQGFISLQNIGQICPKTSNLWCLHYWNLYLYVKKLNIDSFADALFQVKFCPRFLLLPPRQKEIAHHLQAVFFENIPPSRIEGGGADFVFCSCFYVPFNVRYRCKIVLDKKATNLPQY